MLISAVVRYVLLGVGFAMVAGAVHVLRRHRRLRDQAALPDAQVVDRRAIVPVLLRWLPIAAIPAGLVIAYWAYQHKYEVLIVIDGVGGPEVSRRYSADRETTYPLAPGQRPVSDDTFVDPVWVINKSSRPVRVETIQYGRGLAFGSAPTEIPPQTAAHVRTIEHVGPHDRPPSQVRDDVNLGMAFRDWLTWDP